MYLQSPRIAYRETSSAVARVMGFSIHKIVIGFMLVVMLCMIGLKYGWQWGPIIPLSDEKDNWRHWNWIHLPPSGYRPGHLLHDTLKNDMLKTPPYMDIGRYAYREFVAAPKAQRSAVLGTLRNVIRPLDEWIAGLDAADIDLLCIGESHQDNYRRFLGERFFPRYRLDILFLEARELPARLMGLRTDIGEQEVELLNADIARIIRAVQARNPAIAIFGIEESRSQQSHRKRVGYGSRDNSIVENVIANYRSGERTAVLLGALHCTQDRTWLYAQLKRRDDRELRDASMRSLRVMSRRKDLMTREFVRFLQSVGFDYEDYVITDTAALPPVVHDWFLNLSHGLTRYETVIVFDEEADNE